MKKRTVFGAIAASTVALAALAHGGATGIVKERMDAMDKMGDAVKAVTPIMRGEVTYDPDAVRQAAETFRVHSGKALTDLFPEGSGGSPSEANGAIWSEWDAFSALAVQLGDYAEGLAGAAENGLAGSGETGMSADSMMGGGTMMGSGTGMMGGAEATMSAEEIAEMPADKAFVLVSQVCSACHSRFRAKD